MSWVTTQQAGEAGRGGMGGGGWGDRQRGMGGGGGRGGRLRKAATLVCSRAAERVLGHHTEGR